VSNLIITLDEESATGTTVAADPGTTVAADPNATTAPTVAGATTTPTSAP
jgi:hypothetical protein